MHSLLLTAAMTHLCLASPPSEIQVKFDSDSTPENQRELAGTYCASLRGEQLCYVRWTEEHTEDDEDGNHYDAAFVYFKSEPEESEQEAQGYWLLGPKDQDAVLYIQSTDSQFPPPILKTDMVSEEEGTPQYMSQWRKADGFKTGDPVKSLVHQSVGDKPLPLGTNGIITANLEDDETEDINIQVLFEGRDEVVRVKKQHITEIIHIYSKHIGIYSDDVEDPEEGSAASKDKSETDVIVQPGAETQGKYQELRKSKLRKPIFGKQAQKIHKQNRIRKRLELIVDQYEGTPGSSNRKRKKAKIKLPPLPNCTKVDKTRLSVLEADNKQLRAHVKELKTRITGLEKVIRLLKGNNVIDGVAQEPGARHGMNRRGRSRNRRSVQQSGKQKRWSAHAE